jgi:hypothetical protein
VQNDFTYLAIILGLFALMFALVYACDRIIGSDEEALADEGRGASEASVPDERKAAA